jgi:hypothetical protein
VVIPQAGPTGTAGSLLYALATVRVAAQGAVVSQLVPQPVAAMICAAAHDSSLCDQLTKGNVTPTQDPATVVLPSADVAAQSGKGSASPSPRASIAPKPVPPATGGTNWELIGVLLVAVGAAGWFLGGGGRLARRLLAGPQPLAGGDGGDWAPDPNGTLAAGRGRQAPPPGGPVPTRPPAERSGSPSPSVQPRPRPRPQKAPGPGEGIVRTLLSPEGYVEIDGLLHRATWQGGQPAPGRGAVVVLVQDSHGELAAVEEKSSRPEPAPTLPNTRTRLEGDRG